MTNTNGSRCAQSRLIPAVAYIRRSSDSESQETSIPEQNEGVQKLADGHGYRIARWYIDDAISGDDTKKRRDFLRMIEDARAKGDFEAILCWDQKRFGRFDMIEYGYYVHPLREAGVILHTVVEGVTDWNDPSMRIVAGVKQEGAHNDLINHSANVARGQLAAAKAGGWVGSPPYAYRIEGPKKGKRLVLGEPHEVRVVKRIYREFVEEGRSTNNIASRLQAEGFPSPGGRGKPWRYDTVKVILENPAYAGDFAACRWSYGKYHTIRNGSVVKAKPGGRYRKPEAEWEIHRDHHEPIIDRATWEKAQAILARGKTGRSPYTPENNPYVLSGVLRCGKCGGPLKGEKNAKYRWYECGNREYNGPDACEGTTVREDVVLRSVADFLEGWLGQEGQGLDAAAYFGALKAEDVLPEKFQEIKQILLPDRPKVDRKRLDKLHQKLTADLAKARSNLALIDPENIPAVQERIRQMDAERAELEREIRESKPPAEKDINEMVLAVMHSLYTLAGYCRSLSKPSVYDDLGRRGVDHGDGTVSWGSLHSAAPRNVKWLLGRTSHIVCHTTRRGRGTGIRHIFVGGEIVFEVGGITGDLNPHLIA